MRPQRRQAFRTDAASRLDNLELVTALLERDVTNAGAICSERGALVRPLRRRRRHPNLRRLAKVSAASAAKTRRAGALAKHLALHPRLFSGARATLDFGIDLMIVLSTMTAAVAVLTVAYMLGAPPV
jgi:hypothetical protein